MKLLERESFKSDREGYIWAAALFNGEGTTYQRHANKGKQTYVTITIGQKNREVLDIFREVMGFLGSIHGPGKDNCHRYTASGKTAELLIERMSPWLSIEKRSQAQLVFDKVNRFYLEQYASTLNIDPDSLVSITEG